jgi:hypothetical protein
VNNSERLISIASPAIMPSTYGVPDLEAWELNSRVKELRDLLNSRNGFYAFESALHVLPLTAAARAEVMDLVTWNRRDLWRECFDGCCSDMLFFAEDVFGVQFAVKGSAIVTFDPESGDTANVGGSIEEWSQNILSDYSRLTGYRIAHAWQAANGPLPPGRRLLPKIPFVLGGAFEIDNLFAVDAVKGMKYRAEIWRQIRDLPDGAQVRLMPLPLH